MGYEWKRRAEQSLAALLTEVTKMSVKVDEMVAAVAAEKVVVQSAVTLLNQLTTLLQAAIDTGDVVKIQAALDDVNAQRTQLADAVAANTPAAP